MLNIKGQILAIQATAPTRPLVILESDDWGRAGAPSIQVFDSLRAKGIKIGGSPWDFYGLETEEDITKLGDILAGCCDMDGRPACFTTNFVMANADLQAIASEGFLRFHWVPISRGFPEPWGGNLVDAYKRNIERGVFCPGLHGFTHFNVVELMRALGEASPRGELARALATADVPYLASLTPEYNFALVSRTNGEHYLGVKEQAEWVERGVQIFTDTFGRKPRTTCAPGYRSNTTTMKLWQEHGIEAFQAFGMTSRRDGGLLGLERNVRFEPALDGASAVSAAAAQVRSAIAQGKPAIICTHSINYISRHLARAEESLQKLRELLVLILREHPQARFANDEDLIDATRGQRAGWFRPPTGGEMRNRVKAIARASVRKARLG